MAIATPIKITKRYMTEEEFLRLPDDGRKYELVGGEAKVVPAGFEHDIIGATVIALLRPHAKGRGFIAGSQAGFRMTSHNVRCPDVSFTLKSRLPDGKPGKGFGEEAPDLCIEVISPSEEQAEIDQKVREYFASGAQQVWQMYPETQTIYVFTALTKSQVYGPQDMIDAGSLLPGFRCLVSDLFALE